MFICIHYKEKILNYLIIYHLAVSVPKSCSININVDTDLHRVSFEVNVGNMAAFHNTGVVGMAHLPRLPSEMIN